ncbi:hypothetical protein Y032_0183g925 [Ancylostoma ceylanicum]|uniref:G-protein coupled receptors family 1 profile domain-containing protein n=1 Tax=Ancylostoma ceylanicum TaxID=53326 RepID=A0A016SSJ5_9BILA|nr:hypothetical protein Y032_0183g925 [Ancylostoma ceylanicum]
MPSLGEINDYWVIGNTIFFIVFGTFGNINIIWSTIRKKELQSKSGLLLAITSAHQIVCLLSAPVCLTIILLHIKVKRSVCYPMIAPFMSCSSHQAPLVLSSALDLLFVLLDPVRYRAMRTLPYVIAHCIPGGIYSAFFTVYGWMMMDNDVLDFCNPVVAPHPVVMSWWVASNMAINVCILIAYLTAFVILKSKAAYSEHRGVVRRLSVIVMVFVFSWLFAITGVGISIFFRLPGEILPIVVTDLGFFAMLCYAQNYYVCYWRSSDYRRAFKEQLSWMLCKRSLTKQISSVSVPVS